MLKKIWSLVLLIFIFSALTRGQVKIIVLPEHEKNFNKLIAWLGENKLFKDNELLINLIRETFLSAKAGDYEKYSVNLNKFRKEFGKLSDEQKSELLKFMLSSLTPVKRTTKPLQSPGCNADCLLTSCETTCPTGTKPKCQCGCFLQIVDANHINFFEFSTYLKVCCFLCCNAKT
ncbi:MAG: hypothetical protein ABDI07_09365 [Candidatus Kryptonium sp.]